MSPTPVLLVVVEDLPVDLVPEEVHVLQAHVFVADADGETAQNQLFFPRVHHECAQFVLA